MSDKNRFFSPNISDLLAGKGATKLAMDWFLVARRDIDRVGGRGHLWDQVQAEGTLAPAGLSCVANAGEIALRCGCCPKAFDVLHQLSHRRAIPAE